MKQLTPTKYQLKGGKYTVKGLKSPKLESKKTALEYDTEANNNNNKKCRDNSFEQWCHFYD